MHAATEHVASFTDGAPFVVHNGSANGAVVLVCEHACNTIPSRLNGRFADHDTIQSHAGWDPGALAVASRLSRICDAPLVAATVSRLVYDLNRPPDSPDAMRTSSEIYEIPGNSELSTAERAERIAGIYTPFHNALTNTIRNQTMRASAPVLVTVHTFAPVYFGKQRDVQIGILHDEDSRLADAILEAAPGHTNLNVQRNQPYSASDGVTHTLRKHALPDGLLNVMIEVRNDLVRSSDEQQDIASLLAAILREALSSLGVTLDINDGGVCR